MKATIFTCIILVSLSACKNEPEGTKVRLHFIPFYSEQIFLERLSLEGEKNERIDSAFLDYRQDKFQIEFKIRKQEERAFQLRIGEVRIPFINDVSLINIHSKRPDLKEYSFRNPGINSGLKRFLDEQNQINKDSIRIRGKRELMFAD